MGRVGFVIAWFILIGAGVGAGQAATRTFIGTNLANWSAPGNWSGNTPPADGDDVVFPVGVAANSTNDIAGLDLRSITAEANHRIHGNALTVSDGVFSDAPWILRLSAPVALNGNQEWSGVLIADQLDIAGHTLTTTGASTAYSLEVTTLSGAGAIIKNDQGVLAPASAAGYTGSFTANVGILLVTTSSGLGTSDGTAATATVINDGATLFVQNVATIADDITLNGLGTNSANALSINNPTGTTFTGAITLASSASVWGDGPGNPAITFSGPVGGPGDLLIFNSTLVKLGSSQNSFTGRVRFIGPSSGALWLTVAQALAQTGGIELGVFAALDLGGFDQTIPWLGGHGVVANGNTLTIANETDAAFMGVIVANVASVVKKGAGELTLGGANTYAGPTSIEEGTLRVTAGGTLGSSAGATRILGNTVLVLDGAVPGNEPIVLTRVQPADTPTLRVTAAASVLIGGSLTLDAGSVIAGSGSGAEIVASGLITSTGDLRITGVAFNAGFPANQFQAGTITVDAGAALNFYGPGAFGTTATKALHLMGAMISHGPHIIVNGLTGTGEIFMDATTILEVAPPAGTNVFDGSITGGGTLVKKAAGTLRLTSPSLTLGWVTVDGGELAVSSNGFSVQNLVVNPGATLGLDVALHFTGSLILSNIGSGAGPATLAIRGDDVELAGDTLFLNPSSRVHVTAPHKLRLGGAVEGMSLTAYGTGSVLFNAASNALVHLVAGRDATPAGAGTVRLAKSNALNLTSGAGQTSVEVVIGSTLDLAGFSQTLSSAVGNGRIDTGTAAGVLTLLGPSTVFPGRLAGPGTVVVENLSGSFALHGTHTLTGTFRANASLDIETATVMPAAVIARAGLVTIGSGATLGPLTLENTAEYLRVGGSMSQNGIVTGGLTLPAAGATKVWLTAATPRIIVNGAVQLAGTLAYDTSAILPLPTPANGTPTVLTLVDNDGTDPITGTFAQFPEGSRVIVGSAEYRLSYVGGTGNDVTLTALPGAAVMTYHLAEGATGTFFDTDLLIANPTSDDVFVDITFLPETGAPIVEHHAVYAMSRLTLKLDDVAGLENTSFSTIVAPRDNVPLAVERTMRWDATGYGAHTEKATSGPETTWYFAEGAEGFFHTFLLLANPQPAANVAHVEYLREGMPAITRSYDLQPSSRRTIAAGDDEALIGQAFGMTVAFDQPGVAERAMYFGTSPILRGGHESAGATAPSFMWLLAEGATGAGFETFILVANPGSEASEVTFTFLPESGTPVTITRNVAAASRITINPEGEAELAALPLGPVATQILATKPVIAERAMYWPLGPADWTEAHNSFGVTDAATRWGLAEGRAGGVESYQTYILLANPGTDDATVTLTFLAERSTAASASTNAAPAPKTIVVPAQRRVNVAVDPTGAAGDPATMFGTLITSDQPVVVERAMYWDVNGEVWAAGTNATATRLP